MNDVGLKDYLKRHLEVKVNVYLEAFGTSVKVEKLL